MQASLRSQVSTRAAGRASARAKVACNAIKVYTSPGSRGKIIEWYVKELGDKAKDIELVELNMKEQEHKTEWFMKIHPMGQVPAMSDGDFNLYESGAILQYIADKVGDTPDSKSRATLAKWALFGNSTFANSVFMENYREKMMPRTMGLLDAHLATHKYIDGDSFSVNDIAIGAYCMYVPLFFPDMDLSPWPNVQAYMARLAERPACMETVGAPRAPPSTPPPSSK